ncbi:cellulose-binding protein [Marinomonas piezotolerans]|uniref:Cellulose-binding protein n=1 Tax=Marinomonas piezotolerans TaxID=2213058 RepID=A0A370U8M4_9GAMM|nr:cellulose-binding protein [Marinomonas piezotolerans]RDL44146.1 cellulose-binding protein [Marinomonas piezotolerans]
MLKELSKHFEHYAIHARFMPVFVVLFPLVLTVLAWYPQAKTILGATMTLLISFGIMSFLSIYISNLGNDLQDNYFKKWGGAPSTLLLLPSNKELDRYTKQRYFKWLNRKCSGLDLPDTLDGQVENEELYEKIRSASNYMREYTRDRKKYSQIYNDNVAYGFARNIVAIKKAGLVVASISLVSNGLFLYFTTTTDFPHTLNSMGIISLFTSIICLLIHCFVLNEKFVKRRGYRYARTLFEACDK